MNFQKKKELAKELYLNTTLTQKEIAERVGVTEKTLKKWREAGDWEKLKSAMLSTKDEIISRYLRMINSILEIAENDDRAVTDAEADKISKLNKAMDAINKELGLSVIIQVFQEYNAFLLPLNTDLAKANNIYQDKFINIKAIGK